MALSPLTKLDRLVETFTAADDQKLGRGEVEALAGFYQGLGQTDQAKVKDRIIELYQDSRYTRGQQQAFLARLNGVGLSTVELEGAAPNDPNAFLKMTRGAQLERLGSIQGEAEGFAKEVSSRAVPTGIRTQIAKSIAGYEKGFLKGHADAEFGDRSYTALYLAPGRQDRGEGLVGYSVLQGIYADDHDAARRFFFNLKGVRVGYEYAGE